MNAVHSGLINPAIADMRNAVYSKATSPHTTGQKVEGIAGFLALIISDNNGVTGIVTTGTSSANVRLSGKDVHKLSLALVTPLGSETTSLLVLRETERKVGTYTTVTPSGAEVDSQQ